MSHNLVVERMYHELGDDLAAHDDLDDIDNEKTYFHFINFGALVEALEVAKKALFTTDELAFLIKTGSFVVAIMQAIRREHWFEDNVFRRKSHLSVKVVTEDFVFGYKEDASAATVKFDGNVLDSDRPLSVSYLLEHARPGE